MKIAFDHLDIPEGKVRYNDPAVTALVDKFQPAKVSPYYMEFLRGGFDAAEAILMPRDRVLDLLILDIERLENRIHRSESETEKERLREALAHLENEQPLCSGDLPAEAREAARAIGACSVKPCVLVDVQPIDVDAAIRDLLERAGRMFFYTAGKQEVHAWLVHRGADAVTCAARIHSDLARGFIKAEIIPVDLLLTTHSMQSARAEGLTRLVDRNAVIEPQTVLEIRFNV